ncbi:MAG: HAMP domain-containing sensor histidine kinase [Acidobacteriota bacterium]|nr:HAMP domain-containing sensor histidine kinase [Acidobacteriota bacterium]
MRRFNFPLFFGLPFAGLIVLLFIFSFLNRSYVQTKTRDLVREQLQATVEILTAGVARLLDEGQAPDVVLGLSAGREQIYYLALLDGEDNILSWKSVYEGYLPLTRRDASRTEPWIIPSPAGSILNFLAPVAVADGRSFRLYLGYSLSDWEEMIARSNRNLLALFGALAAAGVVFFIGVYGLQKRYLAKAKEAEEEKREKERFREISSFTSVVAHEIKNPLNSLALLCELLHRKGPPEVMADVALGREEVRRISDIIDRFSASLKPLRPHRENLVLRDVVREARDSVAPGSAKPGVEFRYTETSPIRVFADRDLLIQALQNLFRNAFEATESGEVAVKAEMIRGEILVRIEDTGRGMPPDEAVRIFEPFFSTKDQGMGIGLYAARKIVEAHGGRIDVESEPGRGTTFLIQLSGVRHE